MHASLSDALHALPPPTPGTWSAQTLLRLRTCAALCTALASARNAGAKDADLARIVYATYLHVTTTLISDAQALEEAEAYWRRVTRDHMRAGLLWLQTLPGRLVWGRRQTKWIGLHGVRAEAEAKCERLHRAYEATARALGALAIAWHTSSTSNLSMSERAKTLCKEGWLALSSDLPSRPKDHLSHTTAAFLDAVVTHEAGVSRVLRACGIPSVMTHAWPLLIVYPLVSWGATSLVYRHWTQITTQMAAAWETVQGLVVGWVYVPALRLLDTLRAGRKERALLVRRESLAADEQSLERMVESLGRDTLQLDPAALADLAARTRAGDLTPVWQVYEAAMRSPVRGFVSGSLVRTLLIHVQKAKVDLEIALSGIDWLLKSQELLLGAVGLAPALGLVYVLYASVRGSVRWLCQKPASLRASSTTQLRMDAWQALRRADARCCYCRRTSSASSSHGSVDANDPASSRSTALLYGRLLLDLRVLRTSLAALIKHACHGDRLVHARLLSEADADLHALECADAWTDRANVVARMWRSWGHLISVQ